MLFTRIILHLDKYPGAFYIHPVWTVPKKKLPPGKKTPLNAPPFGAWASAEIARAARSARIYEGSGAAAILVRVGCRARAGTQTRGCGGGCCCCRHTSGYDPPTGWPKGIRFWRAAFACERGDARRRPRYTGIPYTVNVVCRVGGFANFPRRRVFEIRVSTTTSEIFEFCYYTVHTNIVLHN